MNNPANTARSSPSFVIVLVVSWLSVRGIFWILDALFFQEPGFGWQAALIDGLLGIFCFSLALQLWCGITGVTVPVIIMLMMHIGIHVHRWAVLDPHGWWAISTIQRLQVVFESGISLLLITLLIFFPRPRGQFAAQE
ncbi:MAG: hypothetical protein VX764_07290 [Planctomycetota bacterium]|nr:hypothetical protein [Planctomycetota bacterium]